MSGLNKKGITATNLVRRANTGKAENLQKFLQFQINPRTRALLPAEAVTEILNINESDILPVPQMPDCVMGIYSWRSEMLWIIDSSNLLGTAEIEPQFDELKNRIISSKNSFGNGLLKQDYQDRELELETEYLMAISLEFQGNFLGFCVSEINDILELDLREMNLEYRDIFSQEIVPFIEGYFVDAEQQLLIVLKVISLFNWQENM